MMSIDASVARTAGPPEATHPTAANCRDFLQAVLTICHRVVMNPENDNQRAEIVKDIHLLEAALASDQRIVSLNDNTARKWFNQAVPSHPPLKEIAWVNPNAAAEQPIDWLERGAPLEPQRMLGQKP